MSRCGTCGCQVESPFDGKTVIHDTTRCGSLAEPTGSHAEDGAELPREELLRRYRNQQAWHRAFASSLDNIPIIRCIPGGGDDGCRMPDEIRRVIETLAHYCPVTWEHGFMGRAKQPNNKVSHDDPK